MICLQDWSLELNLHFWKWMVQKKRYLFI